MYSAHGHHPSSCASICSGPARPHMYKFAPTPLGWGKMHKKGSLYKLYLFGWGGGE